MTASQNSTPPGNQLMTLDETSKSSTADLNSEDLYFRLGVTGDATEAVIKAAFRALSKTHHPDRGGTDEDFSRLREAYDILMDPVSRKVYDQLGIIRGRDYWLKIEEAAKKQMASVLSQVVNHEDRPDTTDIVENILELLSNGPPTFKREEKAANKKRAKIKKMIKRFRLKKKAQSDFVKEFLEKQLKDCDDELERINETRDVHSKMVELISDYEYQHDESEPIYTQSMMKEGIWRSSGKTRGY